jgi:hypothetical protein
MPKRICTLVCIKLNSPIFEEIYKIFVSENAGIFEEEEIKLLSWA